MQPNEEWLIFVYAVFYWSAIIGMHQSIYWKIPRGSRKFTVTAQVNASKFLKLQFNSVFEENSSDFYNM